MLLLLLLLGPLLSRPDQSLVDGCLPGPSEGDADTEVVVLDRDPEVSMAPDDLSVRDTEDDSVVKVGLEYKEEGGVHDCSASMIPSEDELGSFLVNGTMIEVSCDPLVGWVGWPAVEGSLFEAAPANTGDSFKVPMVPLWA